MAVAEPRQSTHRTLWLLCFCLTLLALYFSFQLADVHVDIDQHVAPLCVSSLPFARWWFALLVFCIAVKCGLHVMVLLPVLCRQFQNVVDAKFLMVCEYFFVQVNLCSMLWLAREAWLWSVCVAGVLGAVGLVWGLQAKKPGLLMVAEELPVRNSAVVGALAVASVWVVLGLQGLGVSMWYVVPVEAVVVALTLWCLDRTAVARGAEKGLQGAAKAHAELCLMLVVLDIFVFYHVIGNMMHECLDASSMIQMVCETLVFGSYCVEYGVLRERLCVGESGGYGSCFV